MSLTENSNLIHSFENLGLSPNEAKVYLALIENHPITGYQLAKVSGILRPIVYEMLGRLVEKGGARIVKSTPDTYAPVEINEFLKNIESDFSEARKYISGSLDVALEPDHSDFFWNLIGQKTIVNAIDSLIQKCTSKLLLSIHSETQLDFILPSLQKAQNEKQISIDIFSYYQLDSQGITTYSYNLDSTTPVKQLPLNTLYIVSDEKEALIANMTDVKTAKAVHSRNSALIKLVKRDILQQIYFIRLWKLLGTDKLKMLLNNEDRKILEMIDRMT